MVGVAKFVILQHHCIGVHASMSNREANKVDHRHVRKLVAHQQFHGDLSSWTPGGLRRTVLTSVQKAQFQLGYPKRKVRHALGHRSPWSGLRSNFHELGRRAFTRRKPERNMLVSSTNVVAAARQRHCPLASSQYIKIKLKSKNCHKQPYYSILT